MLVFILIMAGSFAILFTGCSILRPTGGLQKERGVEYFLPTTMVEPVGMLYQEYADSLRVLDREDRQRELGIYWRELLSEFGVAVTGTFIVTPDGFRAFTPDSCLEDSVTMNYILEMLDE